MFKRFNDILSIPDSDKGHILYIIDNLLASIKTRLATHKNKNNAHL